MNKTTMEHNTAGYPHPQPPPEYTPNPLPQYTANSVPILQPPVITQQPVQVVHVHAQPMVGPTPTMVVCLNCHQNVLTRLEYEATMRTHTMALLCCIFGLIPCAIMPYCMTSCQNGNHYCPNCGSFVGTYTQ